MNKQIAEAAKKANGTRRSRILSNSDMAEFEQLVEAHKDDPEIRTIRVYSHEGFVPNSYKYRADISVLEAVRSSETGQFSIHGFTVDAKRSHGNGALVTINSRAA